MHIKKDVGFSFASKFDTMYKNKKSLVPTTQTFYSDHHSGFAGLQCLRFCSGVFFLFFFLLPF
jgi:hypothetical protein